MLIKLALEFGFDDKYFLMIKKMNSEEQVFLRTSTLVMLHDLSMSVCCLWFDYVLFFPLHFELCVSVTWGNVIMGTLLLPMRFCWISGHV